VYFTVDLQNLSKRADIHFRVKVMECPVVIDAPYRETGSEVRQYRKEGVLTVEMEAAALFAAGKCRGAQVASLFSVSDLLSKLPWKPGFHVRRNQAGLERIYQVAVDALTSQPSKALSRVRK
jgi:purine-nucleoside phosphorylase